jgi:hypothetical protein
MSKLLLVGVLVMVAALALPPNVLAQGSEQADHMLLNLQNEAAGSNVGYCGLSKNAEPWTLNIAVSAGTSAAAVTVQFQDGDIVTFDIPANTSFSKTQAMGGASGLLLADQVDNVVRIELTTGEAAATAWVSARARPNTLDAFVEAVPEVDNLCVNIEDEGPVQAQATVLDTAAGWTTGGVGTNLQ